MTKAEIISLYEETEDFYEVVGATGMSPLRLHLLLAKAGILKIQDKINYGTRAQRLGGQAEAMFQKLVPNAIDANKFFKKNNPVYDFMLEDLTIDVKYSSWCEERSSWKCRGSSKADLFVLFLEKEKGTGLKEPYIMVIPKALIADLQTIFVSKSGIWFNEFLVKQEELNGIIEEYATLK